MVGVTWRALLLALVTISCFGSRVTIAMPPTNDVEEGVPLSLAMHEPRQDVPSEDFSGGFSKDFSINLPTNEFWGNFHGRIKRQVGVSSAIENILNTPYGSELAGNHIQALLTRNNFRRPARQSASSRPFSQPSRPPPTPSQFQSNVQNPRQQHQQRQPQPTQPISRFPNRPSFPRAQNPPQNFRVTQNSNPRPRPNFSPNTFSPSRPAQDERLRSESLPGPSFIRRPLSSFPNFSRFFESDRRHRHKRQAGHELNVQSQISEIINSPYKDTLPDSIASLHNQGNGLKSASRTNPFPFIGQKSKNSDKENHESEESINSFEAPFKASNFFQRLGIRKRSANAAANRQGITDALDAIITSPYEGNVPSSIQSLLISDKNRFVRKAKPSFQHTPLASNDPSIAAGRLVPSENGPSSEYNVDLGSGHIFFRGHSGRKKRSITNERVIPRKIGRRFPPPRALRNSRRIRPSNRLRIHPNARANSGSYQEFSSRENYNQRKGKRSRFQREPDNHPQISSEANIKNLNFMANFNTPLESDLYANDPYAYADALLAAEEFKVLSAQRSKSTARNNHRIPPRPPRQSRFMVPGFRPGPSPPAHILPPSSTVRAPRHIIRKNRRLRKATRQLDIPVNRRSLEVMESKQVEDKILPDVPAAKEQSLGFIIGKPSDFPVFSAIGGFGPMADHGKGKDGDSFVPDFNPPVVVEVTEIEEEQPQFSPQQFTQQLFE